MSDNFDLELNSVDSDCVVIVLEVVGALEILTFEWKIPSWNSSADSAAEVEEGSVPEVDRIEVVDITLDAVFGFKLDMTTVDGSVVDFLYASVVNTIVVGISYYSLRAMSYDYEVWFTNYKLGRTTT